MEQEVSSISKLGIVLISLAVLIALGFGIFQISKSVANQGVGDVQQELDGVIKTDEPRTLDFSGVRGFLVTNVCIVQRSTT